jgi:putative transposase
VELRSRDQSRPDASWANISAACSALAGRLFGTCYTLRGMSFLLHRIGYSPQVPVHRAVERDEAAIAQWRAVTWAKARG